MTVLQNAFGTAKGTRCLHCNGMVFMTTDERLEAKRSRALNGGSDCKKIMFMNNVWLNYMNLKPGLKLSRSSYFTEIPMAESSSFIFFATNEIISNWSEPL